MLRVGHRYSGCGPPKINQPFAATSARSGPKRSLARARCTGRASRILRAVHRIHRSHDSGGIVRDSRRFVNRRARRRLLDAPAVVSEIQPRQRDYGNTSAPMRRRTHLAMERPRISSGSLGRRCHAGARRSEAATKELPTLVGGWIQAHCGLWISDCGLSQGGRCLGLASTFIFVLGPQEGQAV